MTFDAILLILVLFVCKPLILLLIYLEIFIKVIILAITTLLTEISCLISPVTMIIGAMFILPHHSSWFLTNITAFTLYLRKLWLMGPAQLKTYEQIWKCVLCIGSLSLLLRFVSGLPTPTLLNKHAILDEMSLIYRFFKFAI